ncbi:MAG: PGL/p-HBAD biosynthesis glycosyltransferase [Spirochaetes bacterium ADurb.Bin001]|jgi:glycosyltransferase involved in cell wall biosynthesis|nr:MAG: PGL/p-HBAD biosynthesis glycosyltransferase [Spirochaetes bacterium ADurb.Bin001]
MKRVYEYMNGISFSIITATYNVSRRSIEETKKSLLSQGTNNFEWIIIDGSTNRHSSNDIYNAIKDLEIRTILLCDRDKGIFDAFNKGLGIARGEWIGFLGCGDTYYENTLKNIEEMLNSLNNYDILYGIVDITREDGAHYWFARSEQFLIEGEMMHHSACFVKNSAYKEIGGFNCSYKSASDLDAFIRLYQKGKKFYFLNIITTAFHQGGISTKGRLPYEEKMKIMIKYGFVNRKEKIKYDLKSLIHAAKNRLS